VDVRGIGDQLEGEARLDAVVGPLNRAVAAMPPDTKRLLQGAWLGHPLHPMLTDLPIGFWTSAWLLDIVGGRRAARVATAMVGLGVVTAVPTIASGLADWSDLPGPKQRAGVVHAAANIVATALYASSFVARWRGQRFRGLALGMAGAGAATVGGYLGGHLVFGSEVPDESSSADRAGDGALVDLDLSDAVPSASAR
jgi:uncharacterized membrane protein